MGSVRGFAGTGLTSQQKELVSRVDERVNRLSQHRGRARKRRGSELRGRDSQIAGQGSVDNSGGRTDQRHTLLNPNYDHSPKPDWHSTADEIAYSSSAIRPYCVNATWRPLYQHWSYSKHQAVEWRRFLA